MTQWPDRPTPTPGRVPIFVGRSPPYLHTDELADLLNRAFKVNTWSSRKVRRRLLREGATVQFKESTRRRQVVTTRELLQEQLPELYNAILRSLPGDEFEELVED